MIKKFKNIMGKLIIAQKKNKKILKINFEKSIKNILNLLWNQGLIYGYKKLNNKVCIIFFKYSSKGFFLLKRLYFFNKILSYQKLKILIQIEKNYSFFLLNDKGFFCQKSSLGLGGHMFVKI